MNFDEMWIFTQVQLVKYSRSWSFLAKSKMKQGLLEGILPEKLKHLRHSTHSTSAWWYKDSQGQLDALSLMSGNHHLAYKKPSKLTYYNSYHICSQFTRANLCIYILLLLECVLYEVHQCKCQQLQIHRSQLLHHLDFAQLLLSFLPERKKERFRGDFWAWLGTSGRSWESSDFICDSVDLCHTHPKDGSSWMIFKMCLNILVILDCRRTLNTTCPWCSAWFAVQSLLDHA